MFEEESMENLSVEYIGGIKSVRDNWAVLEPADDSNPKIHNSSNMLFTRCIHSMAETTQVIHWRATLQFDVLRCIS